MRPLVDRYGFGVTAQGFGVAAVTRVLDALTPAQIAAWKLRADEAAHALAAEPQTEIWDAAVEALLERPPA
jgi:erythromycin esterase-like protein